MAKRIGPNIYIINFPRNASRASWKWYYRMMRVVAREAEKMAIDTTLYGSGFIHFPIDGDPEHIPLEKVMLKP